MKRPILGFWIIGMLATAAVAGARPGDLDPVFRVSAASIGFDALRLTSLADGRLLVADQSSGFWGGGRPTLFVIRNDGQADPSVGDAGQRALAVPPGSRWNELLAVAPDGKLLATASAAGHNQILRLAPDGTLDREFGAGGQVDLSEELELWATHDAYLVERIAVRPDGRMLVLELPWDCGAWWDDACRFRAGPAIVRQLMPDGTVDHTFGTDGRADIPALAEGGFLMSFPLRRDGALVVAGSGGDICVVAADGSHVLTTATGTRVQAGTLLPDGRILLAAASKDGHGIEVVRKLPDGSLDPGFGGGTGRARIEPDTWMPRAPERAEVSATGIAASADGRFVYVGIRVFVNSLNGLDRGFAVARLNADGGLDRTYGLDGISLLAYRYAWDSNLVLDSSDRPIVAVGGSLIRLLADGGSSPGMLAQRQPNELLDVSESAGAVRLSVSRLAGRSGAVSVKVVVQAPAEIRPLHEAVEGKDYVLETTRLDWADGDDSDKEIVVNILNDMEPESDELLSIEIVDSSGGAQIIEPVRTLSIAASDESLPASSSSGASARADTGNSEGGGALAPEGLLLLALWATARARRRFSSRRMNP